MSFLMILCILFTITNQPQAERQDDRDSIHFMVGSFELQVSSRVADLDAFLSPRAQKGKSFAFARRPYKDIDLSGYTTFHIQFTDDSHANVKTSVYWATDKEKADYRAVVNFEKVDGKWYFQDYNFLRKPKSTRGAEPTKSQPKANAPSRTPPSTP